MLPNFVHIGVPKSCSATISAILRRHPEIYTPGPKELNFFNRTTEFSKGLDWYQDTYFSNAADQPVLCDNSIAYAAGNTEVTIHRIRAALGPDTRILLTLRHPADRAYSQYCMARYKGQFEPLDFTDAVRDACHIEGDYSHADMDEIQEGRHHASAWNMSLFRHGFYLVPGRYADLLRHCQTAFGADNVLVLFTEEMASDLQGSIDRLTRFMGVSNITVQSDLRANEATALRYPWLRKIYNKVYSIGIVQRAYHGLSRKNRSKLRRKLMSWNYKKNDSLPKAAPAALALLQDYYEPDMRALQEMLGRDLPGWLDKYSAAKDTA